MNRLVPLRRAVTVMLAISLASCVAARTPPSAALTATAADPGARRAEIARQLARVCPAPMTAAELTAAADLLDHHPDALAVVRRLDLFDRQSHVCRGAHP